MLDCHSFWTPNMSTVHPAIHLEATRLGVIMNPKTGEPHEAWGVLNPGTSVSADGVMHLFPRLIAEGNYSRIGPARLPFDGETPVGVECLGIALERHASCEVNADPNRRCKYSPKAEPSRTPIGVPN